MSSGRRHTWHKHQVGLFHITVEAEPLMPTLAKEGVMAVVAKQLMEVFDTNRLPVTWAVGDPAHSAATTLVTFSREAHELALLGDHHWLGPTAGRTRFARELARRVTRARAQGIEVSTIVPRVAPVDEHIDLIVKHGLRAVVATQNPTARWRPAIIRALHYGVWEFSASERLPLDSSWLFAGWKLQRSITRTAKDTATYHLIIDASAIEQQGAWAIRMLSRMACRAAVLRDRGLLRVETLGATALRMSDLPAATPQRSILRAA